RTAEAPAPDTRQAPADEPAGEVTAMMARFAPADLSADVSGLPESELQTLHHLIEAARVVDGLYLRQVWAGNPAMLIALQHHHSPAGMPRLRYFLLSKGPWSRLDGDAPFIDGVGPKPGGANYYPAGA